MERRAPAALGGTEESQNFYSQIWLLPNQQCCDLDPHGTYDPAKFTGRLDLIAFSAKCDPGFTDTLELIS